MSRYYYNNQTAFSGSDVVALHHDDRCQNAATTLSLLCRRSRCKHNTRNRSSVTRSNTRSTYICSDCGTSRGGGIRRRHRRLVRRADTPTDVCFHAHVFASHKHSPASGHIITVHRCTSPPPPPIEQYNFITVRVCSEGRYGSLAVRGVCNWSVYISEAPHGTIV